MQTVVKSKMLNRIILFTSLILKSASMSSVVVNMMGIVELYIFIIYETESFKNYKYCLKITFCHSDCLQFVLTWV